MTAPHVAIVGGGYSGTLQAIELLNRGARVTLIERASRFARGAAYGTDHEDHLLNVRASGMSAFAERPRHFADWFASETGGGPDDFAQRRVYGRYLGDLLAEARAAAGDRLTTIHGDVQAIERNGGCETLRLADGTDVSADAVVLAIGNLPPEPTRGITPQELPPGVYVDNPWASDFATGLGEDDTVLLVGTGLTAVDAVLMLDRAGFSGRIIALSRRGLLPRGHAERPLPTVPLKEQVEARCAGLLRFVRADSEGDWRKRVDALRPITQQLWQDASLAERRRFLRHLRPWWDVHRHRIAPSIATRIEYLQRRGTLAVHAGKIVRTEADGETACVRWRPRGSSDERSLRVRRIVNCTGPQADIGRARDPLLDSLLATGRIRPDRCRIGIDVDAQSRTLDRADVASESLFAVGPMTRGKFWEIVAVPDIRKQVRAAAENIVKTGA